MTGKQAAPQAAKPKAGAGAGAVKAKAKAKAPRSRAVHCDPEQAVTVENAPLPKSMSKRAVRQKSPAEWAYDRLIPRTRLRWDSLAVQGACCRSKGWDISSRTL